MKRGNSEFALAALRTRGSAPYSPPKMPDLSYRGQSVRIPSKVTAGDTSYAKPIKQYTGDKMIGIATLHKSNGVPVFSQDDAKDISSMRR